MSNNILWSSFQKIALPLKAHEFARRIDKSPSHFIDLYLQIFCSIIVYCIIVYIVLRKIYYLMQILPTLNFSYFKVAYSVAANEKP
jgi:hypothetical protein